MPHPPSECRRSARSTDEGHTVEEQPRTYHDLLAAAQQNPAGADFHTLRMASARSDGYAPYSHDVEAVEALGRALPVADFDAALEAIARLLDASYLDIEAHIAADYVYTRLSQPDRSAYHRGFAQGLLKAIVDTGDGRDFSTAFIVLAIPEEYTVLRMLGLRPRGQALVEHEGHWFDVIDAAHGQTGAPAKVHFNIDIPHAWLHHHGMAHDHDGE
jgi:hypothetical protein